MFPRTTSLTLWLTSLPAPTPWLNHMPIHEAVPRLYAGTSVGESKTERWAFKTTLGFKPKCLWYTGREVMEGNMIVVIVLIWDAKEIPRCRWSACKNMGLEFRRKNQRWGYTLNIICGEKINKAMRLPKERRSVHTTTLEDELEAEETWPEK